MSFGVFNDLSNIPHQSRTTCGHSKVVNESPMKKSPNQLVKTTQNVYKNKSPTSTSGINKKTTVNITSHKNEIYINRLNNLEDGLEDIRTEIGNAKGVLYDFSMRNDDELMVCIKNRQRCMSLRCQAIEWFVKYHQDDYEKRSQCLFQIEGMLREINLYDDHLSRDKITLCWLKQILDVREVKESLTLLKTDLNNVREVISALREKLIVAMPNSQQSLIKHETLIDWMNILFTQTQPDYNWFSAYKLFYNEYKDEVWLEKEEKTAEQIKEYKSKLGKHIQQTLQKFNIRFLEELVKVLPEVQS